MGNQQKESKKGAPKRTGRRAGRIAAYYASGRLAKSRLRRILKSNGPEAAHKWAVDNGEMSTLRGLANGNEANQWRTRERAQKALAD